jgi:hypothetical protein
MDTLHSMLRSIRGETESRGDHLNVIANSSTTSGRSRLQGAPGLAG